MLTSTQRTFYMTPALPLFAIGFGSIMAPIVQKIINHICQKNSLNKSIQIFSYILFIAAVSISLLKIGQKGRDQETLHDVYEIRKYIPQKTNILTNQKVYENWALQFYLIRYCDIYLYPSQKNNYEYCLKEKSDPLETNNLKKINLNTKQFNLYQTIKHD